MFRIFCPLSWVGASGFLTMRDTLADVREDVVSIRRIEGYEEA